MWKPIYDPGPWKAYVDKKENKGLLIMEVRKKYLREQLLFEDFITQQQNVIKGIANKILSDHSPAPEPTSIYPLKLYVQVGLQPPIGSSFTRVIEYIKYVEAGDEAWNGKPVYFRGDNLVDDPNTYDYDPNGVFGDYIRYNIVDNRWEIVGCEFDQGDECNVEIISFGIPIPDPESLLEWGNLIGDWDFINPKYSIFGCSIGTWVGPGNDPKVTSPTLIGFNTYTEDPGTATFGTTYSYQENGQYVLPVGVYNANTSLDCGEEPQPCDSLFNIVELLVPSGTGLFSKRDLNISDEGELVNGRRYWDLVVTGKGSTPAKLYTIRWNGNNWEIVYQENGDPEIVISTNTNHTGDVPYDCSNITGDAPMSWTGNAPYEDGFTTEGTGGIYVAP